MWPCWCTADIFNFSSSQTVQKMLNMTHCTCDRLTSCFLQEEKEQLIEYRSTLASLVGRAKTVVQLRPRSAESALGSTTPIRAICDYRQIEVRDPPCVLPPRPALHFLSKPFVFAASSPDAPLCIYVDDDFSQPRWSTAD